MDSFNLNHLVVISGNKHPVSHQHQPKEDCKWVLDQFSQSVSNYTKCIAKFARPIELCLRCRDEYIAVGDAYVYMENETQDNYTCKEVLTKQDRLNVIGQMYNFANDSDSIWHLASCNNCYENNDPTTNKVAETTNEFESRWNIAKECFERFIDIDHIDGLTPDINFAALVNQEIRDPALCSNCSKVYEDLRSFLWEKVVPSSLDGTLRGVCYDIRDRFNLTGQIWKETFNCEPMPSSWKFVLPVIFCTFLLIVLTYVCEPTILPYFFPSRVEETVALVQQDIYDGEMTEAKEDFVHGNFEVVPGVSADEYIQRFKKVEINLPNGTKSEIRIPPPPEDFYDLEWHNDEWTLPPKELILKMNEVKLQFKRGEISDQEMDIMQCKLILEELNRNKFMKRRPSEMSDIHAQHSSNENISHPTSIREEDE